MKNFNLAESDPDKMKCYEKYKEYGVYTDRAFAGTFKRNQL